MSVEAPAHPLEQKAEEQQEEIARLLMVIKDRDTQIERLTLRVLSKDQEFAKERALWARKERALKEQVKAARKVNR